MSARVSRRRLAVALAGALVLGGSLIAASRLGTSAAHSRCSRA